MRKIFILVSIFIFTYKLSAQVSFAPLIGIDIFKVEGIGYFQDPETKQGFKKVSPNIGFLLLGTFSKRLEYGIRTDFIKFKMTNDSGVFDADAATEIQDIYLRNALRINLKFNNFRIGSGVNTNFVFLEKDNAWRNKKWHFSGFPGNYGMSHFISYQIHDFIFELTYQKDLGRLIDKTFLTEAFSFSIAYLFKIKNKKQIKNKGQCPKF